MELLVLREGVHRDDASTYVDELRTRLDGHTVRHATTPSAERSSIETADVVTGPRIDESLLDAAHDLELFACAYAGYDHLPLDALEDRGVATTTATGVHAPNVAEHVVGSILAFSRRLHEAATASTWQPVDPGELAGSTVTIVGLGAIGRASAERLEPFDVTTLGIRNHPERGGPTDEVLAPDDLHDALAKTDVLVLSCPLTAETRGLIGRSEFATLASDALVVNVARGEVIETDALVAALRGGRIGGAALDVTDPEPLPDDHPLWSLDEVLVTPHSAGATPKYYERLAELVADNVRRLEDGRSLRNVAVPGKRS